MACLTEGYREIYRDPMADLLGYDLICMGKVLLRIGLNSREQLVGLACTCGPGVRQAPFSQHNSSSGAFVAPFLFAPAPALFMHRDLA
jgi:hypothetical protein